MQRWAPCISAHYNATRISISSHALERQDCKLCVQATHQRVKLLSDIPGVGVVAAVEEEGEGAMNVDASMEVASWAWGVDVGLVEETTSGSATSEALPSINNDITIGGDSFLQQSLHTYTHKDAYMYTGTLYTQFSEIKQMHIEWFWYSILFLLMYYLINVLSY